MHFRFNWYIIALIVSSLSTTMLGIFGFRHKKVAGIKPFIGCMAVGATWSFLNALELMGVELTTKLIFANLQYIDYGLAPILWLIMVFMFTGHEERGEFQNILLLLVIPAITFILVWFDQRFGFVRTNFSILHHGNFSVIQKDYGPWFWVHVSYCHLLNMISVVYLVKTVFSRNKLLKKQALSLLGGLSMIMGSNLLFVLGKSPVQLFDISPIVFIASAIVTAWGIFRHSLFKLIPVTRDIVFEKMELGGILTDPDGFILDRNAAAVQILGPEKMRIRDMNIKSVIPGIFESEDQIFIYSSQHKAPDLNQEKNPEAGKSEDLISLEKTLEIHTTKIDDKRRSRKGYLFLIKDISEIQKAKEQILIQQKEIAVSEEQHRVARDLHDNIGQILSFIQVQVQTIQREIKRQNWSIVDDYIEKLKEITSQTHLKLREYVFNLRSPLLQHSSFLSLLNDLMKEYSDHTRISFSIVLEEETELFLAPVDKRMHLISITKEALNNSLKHSGATQIKIGAYRKDKDHCYYVSDDGKGIQKKNQNISDRSSGLKIMQERAKICGGELEVISDYGTGTMIMVRFRGTCK